MAMAPSSGLSSSLRPSSSPRSPPRGAMRAGTAILSSSCHVARSPGPAAMGPLTRAAAPRLLLARHLSLKTLSGCHVARPQQPQLPLCAIPHTPRGAMAASSSSSLLPSHSLSPTRSISAPTLSLSLSLSLSLPSRIGLKASFRANGLLPRGARCGSQAVPAGSSTVVEGEPQQRERVSEGEGEVGSNGLGAGERVQAAEEGEPTAAMHSEGDVPTFQEAIQRLQAFWAKAGCALLQASNTEVGAGTMNPATFLRVLGPEPWRVAYAEPSVRPDDSRYGENPNRVQRHTQFQVILKPEPGNAQELFLGSLAALGARAAERDLRFVEDDWESPALGAWGLGWEVWLDGMEIAQFTYFQQAGSMPLSPVSVEITYGLERIIMALQGVNHFKDIIYAPGITYGELFLENEKEMSAFNLEHADVARAKQRFELYDAEARSMLEKGLPIPAYDNVLKTSHIFNILDARGAIGVTERARFFARMRNLARQCAQLWVETRASLGHPLGTWQEPEPPLPAQLPRQLPDTPRDFVLEIGSEELPPDDVSSGIKQLEAAIPALLARLRLPHGAVSVTGSPRRTAVIVQALHATQEARRTDLRGPPKAKAFDAQGAATKALEGFCRKNNVSVEAVHVREEKGTEYVYVTVQERARPAAEVLAEELPALLAALAFPKTMRWNSSAVYSRPLRWVLALHGEALVPFAFARLATARTTRLLRSAEQPTVEVERAEDYRKVLKEGGITLSMQERRDVIWSASSALAESIGGRIPEEAKGALLEEVANLVEAPVPLLGQFDEKFLELPREVLVTVMKKHQRYFPVEDVTSRRLLPAFVAVPNGRLHPPAVRRGNEAVLRARYDDARFFYKSDTSRPLESFRAQLEGITFQDKLGSMLSKSERIESMVEPLAALLGLSEQSVHIAKKAAVLAMADLGTAMVMEFTSLAGLMGQHYALREGQKPEVAQAVFEFVLPRFAGDELPRSDAGLLLAAADRLDSLVGLFAVGCEPTASADPFGLRRSANALVQSLVANEKEVDLREALSIAATCQPVEVSEPTAEQVLAFVVRRSEQLLVDGGWTVEIVRAVLAERGTNPALAAKSVQQMEAAAQRGDLEKIIAAYARPTRISRGKEIDATWQVDELRFEEDEERALWAAYRRARAELASGANIDEFIAASQPLLDTLDAFFTKVFVMAEDEAVRRNRLALMRDVAVLPRGIVDLSQLPGF